VPKKYVPVDPELKRKHILERNRRIKHRIGGDSLIRGYARDKKTGKWYFVDGGEVVRELNEQEVERMKLLRRHGL